MIAVPDIIIAVDGYSSTGKSSFAKELARTFGFLYLDSGALYRGVTLFAQEKDLISEDNLISDELEQALEGLDLHFGEGGSLYISQRCIESEIRGMKVSSQVSPISALSYVRAYVDERLHANLKERDYIDSHRSVSPLRQADDAFVLDNSDMTMKEELSWIMGVIQGKFGILQ